jgi:hypothetical protein
MSVGSERLKATQGNELGAIKLLPKCPGHKCKEPLPIPSKWITERCKKCGMKYSSMQSIRNLLMDEIWRVAIAPSLTSNPK